MGTITHPVLLIMALWLASTTNKLVQKYTFFSIVTVLIDLKSVITAAICTTLL